MVLLISGDERQMVMMEARASCDPCSVNDIVGSSS